MNKKTSFLNHTEIEKIITWLEEAGEIALKYSGNPYWSVKEDHTPVTKADTSIDNFLSTRLKTTFPAYSLISEESERQNLKNDMVWALDPIDGTKTYLSGLPFWGISLGLIVYGKPTAGFFYMPATHDLYWGCENRGAFFNGKPLEKKKINNLDFDNPLLFLAVPSNAHLQYGIHYPRLHAYGSTAVHLALLARGLAVGVLTRCVNIWDLAGLLTILDLLDIQYQYLSGRSFDAGILLDGRKSGEGLLAAPAAFMEKLRQQIKKTN